jgi:transposase
LGTHEQEQVSAGQVVKGMILNCMGFLSAPLYLFSQFFEGKATEHLIGPRVRPEHLNDTRIGRVLDKLYRYGITKVFVTIAVAVVKKFAIQLNSAHLDSTSLSVEGKYREKEKPEKSAEATIQSQSQLQKEKESDNWLLNEEEPIPVKITHGYSRDHRPDLKQLMINLITSEDGGIPLFLELGNGNDVDKTTFVPVIEEFQQQWSLKEPEVIVGDSALYSAKNIQALGTTSWITLVPATLAAAKELLEGLPPEQFIPTGLNGYRFVELCSTYGDINQRWIVFESKARKEAESKKLTGDIAKAFQKHNQLLNALKIKDFACEADALDAAQAFGKTLKYHILSPIQISPTPHYSKAGRPRKDATPTHYTYNIQANLELNEAVVEARRLQAGRFILATNLLNGEQWEQDEILRTYKKQQSCERGFRFIKDPLFFASSVFLKTPRRIMALTMIMALCLMVYSLGQRQLRQTLKHAQTTLPNQKGQPTNRPTLRWILQCFLSVHLVWLDGLKHIIQLNDRQRLILPFLGSACQKYYLLC